MDITTQRDKRAMESAVNAGVDKALKKNKKNLTPDSTQIFDSNDFEKSIEKGFKKGFELSNRLLAARTELANAELSRNIKDGFRAVGSEITGRFSDALDSSQMQMIRLAGTIFKSAGSVITAPIKATKAFVKGEASFPKLQAGGQIGRGGLAELHPAEVISPAPHVKKIEELGIEQNLKLEEIDQHLNEPNIAKDIMRGLNKSVIKTHMIELSGRAEELDIDRNRLLGRMSEPLSWIKKLTEKIWVFNKLGEWRDRKKSEKVARLSTEAKKEQIRTADNVYSLGLLMIKIYDLLQSRYDTEDKYRSEDLKAQFRGKEKQSMGKLGFLGLLLGVFAKTITAPFEAIINTFSYVKKKIKSITFIKDFFDFLGKISSSVIAIRNQGLLQGIMKIESIFNFLGKIPVIGKALLGFKEGVIDIFIKGVLGFNKFMIGVQKVFKIFTPIIEGINKLFSWGSKGISFIGEILAKIPGFTKLLKFIGVGFKVLGWPFTILMGLIDFVKGFMNSNGDILDKLKSGLYSAIMGFVEAPILLIGTITDWVLKLFGIDGPEGGSAKVILEKVKSGINIALDIILWPFREIGEFFNWIEEKSDLKSISQEIDGETGESKTIFERITRFLLGALEILKIPFKIISNTIDWVFGNRSFADIFVDTDKIKEYLLSALDILKWPFQMIGNAIDWLFGNKEKIKIGNEKSFIDSIFEKIGQVVEAIKQWIFDHIPGVETITGVLSSAKNIAGNIIDTGKGLFNSGKEIVGNAVSGATDWIKGLFGSAPDVKQKSVDIVQSVGNKGSQIGALTTEIVKQKASALIDEAKRQSEMINGQKLGINKLNEFMGQQGQNISSFANSISNSVSREKEAPDELDNFGILMQNYVMT